MKLAIVGAGISGLTCAHLLDPHHDVVVFEAADYLGGHTNTIDVETPAGVQPVDTGFIVLNDRNYPGFTRLLARLGVETAPTEMSFSVSSNGSGGVEYKGGGGPNGLFAQRSNLTRPSFLRMLRDIARFNREGKALVEQARAQANGNGDRAMREGEWLAPRSGGPTLGELLEDGGYGPELAEHHLIPAASAIWSTEPERMAEFPALYLLAFFDNHGMLEVRGRPQWRYIPGGSRRYVDAIAAQLRGRVETRAPVDRIVRREGDVLVSAAGRGPEPFDEVIVAAHSDQALRMLGDAGDAERRVLGAIPYQPNEAVLHSDEEMLPNRRRAWASWNYHLNGSGGQTALTYWMNSLQGIPEDRGNLCVTLNRTEQIAPASVLDVVAYEHPLFTVAGVEAQREHGSLIRANRTSFCGAYWGWGFHEDGVRSAQRVCDSFGVTL